MLCRIERAREKNITNISLRASTFAKLSAVIFAGGMIQKLQTYLRAELKKIVPE
jgi:hypothetical protein